MIDTVDVSSHRREGRNSTAMISVIMPAFNEGKKIRANLIEAIDTFRSLGHPFELIVVNDGSTDDTGNEVHKVELEHSEVILVTYTRNGGKGNALKEGWKYAHGDLVTFVDADLELHPRQLNMFLDEMEKKRVDIVIGSKRHPESIIHYPLKRKILSKCYNLLIRGLFQCNLTDTQPGLKLFKREVLAKEFPKVFVKRYAFDLELLLNSLKDGYTIAEVPIMIDYVRENGGRIKLKDVGRIYKDTMGIFFRIKLTHFYEAPKKEIEPSIEPTSCANADKIGNQTIQSQTVPKM
jgi:glycosyltransferase involved in cell wall biosynthesis